MKKKMKRDINTYNKTYILLYFLLKLFKGYKDKNKKNIKYITLKNPNNILSIKRLIILLFNIFKIKDVFKVLYTLKLNFRPGF